MALSSVKRAGLLLLLLLLLPGAFWVCDSNNKNMPPSCILHTPSYCVEANPEGTWLLSAYHFSRR
jgi:hypothetical protein